MLDITAKAISEFPELECKMEVLEGHLLSDADDSRLINILGELQLNVVLTKRNILALYCMKIALKVGHEYGISLVRKYFGFPEHIELPIIKVIKKQAICYESEAGIAKINIADIDINDDGSYKLRINTDFSNFVPNSEGPWDDFEVDADTTTPNLGKRVDWNNHDIKL